jgi:hypothetical protein
MKTVIMNGEAYVFGAAGDNFDAKDTGIYQDLKKAAGNVDVTELTPELKALREIVEDAQ